MRSHASGGRTTETPLTKAEGVLLSFQLLLLCGSVSLLYSSNTAGKKWQLRLQGYAFPPLVFQAGEEKPVLCNRGAVTPYMLRLRRNSSFCITTWGRRRRPARMGLLLCKVTWTVRS